MGIWLRDPPFAPTIAFGRHDLQNHDFWPKSLPEKAASGTGKREFFAAVGLSSHHDLASRCTVCTFNCVWVSRPAKPRLLTQKPSRKGCLRNGETAWPGELKDTVFRPVLGWSSVSNVASRTHKKWGFGFEIHRLHLQLRLGVTTCKTTTSDPKAFPKRLPPERGNSMAWRAQGHRFSTCVGVIFSVKRCHKKWGFGFEIHRLHLQLRLVITTGKTTTSDPKAFPKRLPPERGNSMAWRAQGHRFSTCVGVIFSVKRCVQNP